MSQSSSNSELGLATVLTIVFVVLKLTGLIAWSWLWVLSPLWITGVIYTVIVASILVVILIMKRKGNE